MTANEPAEDTSHSGWDGQVARNVARVRTARGVSTTRLSAQLKELGQSIPPTGITRIEKGQRRVSAGELAALAVALRVSPLTLLLPWTDAPDEQVDVPGLGPVTAERLWMWADGAVPLEMSESDPQGDEQRYRLDSRPAWARDWSRYLSFMEVVRLGDRAGDMFNEARDKGVSPQEFAETWRRSTRRRTEDDQP